MILQLAHFIKLQNTNLIVSTKGYEYFLFLLLEMEVESSNIDSDMVILQFPING